MNALIDAEIDVLTGARRAQTFDVFHHPSESVLDHATLARLALENVVVGQLYTFLALVIDIGEAKNVRRDLAGRVIATLFFLQIETHDLKALQGIAFVGCQMPLQVDELLVQTRHDQRFELIERKAEDLAQLGPLVARFDEAPRLHPGRLCGGANRKRLAVAIEDHAAVGIDTFRAQIARVAMALQEFALVDLQIQRTPGQYQRTEHEQADHQAAPQLEFATAFIARDHCSSTTRPGVGTTMPSLSLASCSTRNSVPQVACSSSSWPHS